jgi:hypothetical protein
MEDGPVKIAIQRILVFLTWFAMLLGHRALAQFDLTTPPTIPDSRPEGIPPGERVIAPVPNDASGIHGILSRTASGDRFGGSTGPTADTAVPSRSSERVNAAAPDNTAPSHGGNRVNAPGPDSTAPSRSGEWLNTPAPDSAYDPDSPVVGEHATPVGGLFGDGAAPACEWCGGGSCLPPTWTVDTSLALMNLSRPASERLGANSLPAGPLSAGSVVVTNSGVQTQQNFNQYVNDAVQFTALETHTAIFTDSPQLHLTLTRFLGRDGESRDHFLDFSFEGLQSYSAGVTVHGSIIPFYDTDPQIQAIPATPPVALYFQGSLVSPAPIFLPDNGKQQQLLAPSFSSLGRNYDLAFNRSDTMSTGYSSNFNEFEINYRFAGHNQPDQLVLHPNGRWYRECQAGYYYSYFFGAKMMIIDESSDYQSSGSQFASIGPDSVGNYAPAPTAEFTHAGDYSVHTYNTLMGIQSGGKLEYRLCRWCLDTHGNAGMFMNFAHQFSRITTSFTGAPDPAQVLADSIIPEYYTNTDNTSTASRLGAAFAGGFGVAGSYKFLPNLIGHVSYDMMWVGDVARAPEQMIFSSVPETARNIIYTQGSVFYNGVSLGVEWDW